MIRRDKRVTRATQHNTHTSSLLLSLYPAIASVRPDELEAIDLRCQIRTV